MTDAFGAIDTILIVAITSVALIGGLAAFILAALGYWTAVLAVRAARALTHRNRKENTQP